MGKKKPGVLYKANPKDAPRTALAVQFQLTPWLKPGEKPKWLVSKTPDGSASLTWAATPSGLIMASEYADRLASRGMKARVIAYEGAPSLD